MLLYSAWNKEGMVMDKLTVIIFASLAAIGCALHRMPTATPMGELQCAGWRTLANGTSECMVIETSKGMIER